jgi:predicted DNA-binding protein (MmcQ/YjbR family)
MVGAMPTATPAAKAQADLLKFALRYPEAWKDSPWGETVVKVNTKVFLFLGKGTDGLSLSVKLPRSASLALGLPFTAPTAYGLGKSGWVTARFTPKARLPLDILKQWIDESYRAVAPKTFVKRLDGEGASAAKPRAKVSRPRASRG